MLSSLLRVSAQSLFATVFPADCRICNAPLANISRLPVCEACLDNLQPFTARQCAVCGELLSATNPDAAAVCWTCDQVPPHFGRAAAYGPYEGSLRELIHVFKYQRVRTAVPALGSVLAGVLQPLIAEVAEPIVVPVPLYRAKERERSFNQSQQVAAEAVRQLARRNIQVAFRPDALKRIRATRSQTGLTRPQRRDNVRNAFSVARPELVKDRNIILVDDVLTTGTTANECARVLKRSGASAVFVATLARVSKHDFALPAALAAAAGQSNLMEGQAN
jgi:ComF family protein